MEDTYLLVFALMAAGVLTIGGFIWYETAGKERRRKRIERNHARSKLR